jgi:acetylornithine deacetylase/succinyl-diaminopimelate desuccinylase-like protein
MPPRPDRLEIETMPAPLEPVLDAIDAAQPAARARLIGWLAIPSISTDPTHAADCRRAAQWLHAELAGLGFEAAIHETPGHPIVTASRRRGGRPHVLFYGHYDVQPVDPLALWRRDPFAAAIEETAPGRPSIVARGASDDKGQIMTFVEACRAHLAVHGDLPVDVTFCIEGEEEDGSQNLPAFLESHAEMLKADLVLVCDTGRFDEDTPSICTSLRGLAHDEFTIHASSRDLHSGVYGGAAQNPLHVISRIVASLHGPDGRVAIDGFYEGVEETPTQQKQEWEALGLTPETFLGPIGLSTPSGEAGRGVLELTTARPTAEVNGMWGGYILEGGKTVIPAEGHAKITFRLVGDQDPDRIIAAFRAHVRARLPVDCRVSFHGGRGAKGISIPFDLPALQKAKAALTQEWGRTAVAVGMGGSIPVVAEFKTRMGMDTLLVGYALDDDAMHAPNEKYDLKSFHKGARSWARILSALA